MPEPKFRLSPKMTRIAGSASPKAWKIGISLPYHNKYGWDGELKNTLKHEMIHLYLSMKKRSDNHTREFKLLCGKLGCSVYAKQMPSMDYKYIYQCPGCQRKYFFRKKVKLACGRCCNKVYNPRYKLELVRILGRKDYRRLSEK
jgi:hypothetical protein